MQKFFLAITARGSFNLGIVIIMIAVFTGSITAVRSLTHSYTTQTPIIELIAQEEVYSITKTETEGWNTLEIGIVELGDSYAVALSPSNLTALLHIWREKNQKISENGALISHDLIKYKTGDNLKIGDNNLQINAILRIQNKVIILLPEIFDEIVEKSETFYYSELTLGNQINSPSAINLIKSFSKEVKNIINMTTYLLYTTLGLACTLQALYVSREGNEVFTLLHNLHTPTNRVYFSIILLSLTVTMVGVGLGYSIGLVSSASISLVASRLMEAPYLKPSFTLLLIMDIGLAFTAASLGLIFGLIKGYKDATLG